MQVQRPSPAAPTSILAAHKGVVDPCCVGMLARSLAMAHQTAHLAVNPAKPPAAMADAHTSAETHVIHAYSHVPGLVHIR